MLWWRDVTLCNAVTIISGHNNNSNTQPAGGDELLLTDLRQQHSHRSHTTSNLFVMTHCDREESFHSHCDAILSVTKSRNRIHLPTDYRRLEWVWIGWVWMLNANITVPKIRRRTGGHRHHLYKQQWEDYLGRWISGLDILLNKSFLLAFNTCILLRWDVQYY